MQRFLAFRHSREYALKTANLEGCGTSGLGTVRFWATRKQPKKTTEAVRQ